MKIHFTPKLRGRINKDVQFREDKVYFLFVYNLTMGLIQVSYIRVGVMILLSYLNTMFYYNRQIIMNEKHIFSLRCVFFYFLVVRFRQDQ